MYRKRQVYSFSFLYHFNKKHSLSIELSNVALLFFKWIRFYQNRSRLHSNEKNAIEMFIENNFVDKYRNVPAYKNKFYYKFVSCH
jgi:hypothetical protein